MAFKTVAKPKSTKFNKKLTSKKECLKFIELLHKKKLMFHFDDDATEIFKDKQLAKNLNERRDELFKYLDDPYEEAVKYF